MYRRCILHHFRGITILCMLFLGSIKLQAQSKVDYIAYREYLNAIPGPLANSEKQDTTTFLAHSDIHQKHEFRKKGQHQFDFLLGKWVVHNTQFDIDNPDNVRTFDSNLEVKKIMDGLGIIDMYKSIIDGEAYVNINFRIYNPKTGKWKIYWADSNELAFGTPLTGAFNDGVGEFYRKFTNQYGVSYLIKFEWSDITDDSARWEQFYSYDNGVTWKPGGWIMEFKRKY